MNKGTYAMQITIDIKNLAIDFLNRTQNKITLGDLDDYLYGLHLDKFAATNDDYNNVYQAICDYIDSLNSSGC